MTDLSSLIFIIPGMMLLVHLYSLKYSKNSENKSASGVFDEQKAAKFILSRLESPWIDLKVVSQFIEAEYQWQSKHGSNGPHGFELVNRLSPDLRSNLLQQLSKQNSSISDAEIDTMINLLEKYEATIGK